MKVLRLVQPSVSLLVLLVLLSGCSSSDKSATSNTGSPRDITPEGRPFAQALTAVDTIKLSQPDTAPIVRVSGLDIDNRGRIALADVSEANVKVFSPDGELLQILGRKGQAPGEFEQPRFPRFATTGQLHVGDAPLNRISVFDEHGTLLRTVSLAGVGLFSGMILLPNGDYLISTSSGPGDSVLVRTDSLGQLRRRYLPVASVTPRGEQMIEEWRNIRQFWLAIRQDTAFVVATLSDSVWAVDLTSGNVTSVHLSLPGYIKPTAPRGQFRSIKELADWSQSFHLSAGIVNTDDGLLINFVQGILNYGDPNMIAYRDQTGTWHALTDALPVIAGRHASVILASARDSATTDVVLELVTPRGGN